MCLALFQGCLALLQPRCPHSAHTSPVLGQEKPGLVWKSRERGKPEQPMLSTRQGRFWDHAQNVFVPLHCQPRDQRQQGLQRWRQHSQCCPRACLHSKGQQGQHNM